MGRLNAIHPDEPHTILKVRGVAVRVLNVYEMGGVRYAEVEALDGKPFRASGTKVPYWFDTSTTTVTADELTR